MPRESKIDRKKPAAILLLFLATTLGGCIAPESIPSDLKYSPDGQFLAYTWEDRTVALTIPSNLVPTYVVVSQTHSIYWCRVNQPKQQKHIQIDTGRPKKLGHHLLLVQTRFSPDSKHLAVVTAKGTTVIDLESGKHWKLSKPNEYVTALAWITGDEICYVAITPLNPEACNSDESSNLCTRTFWRQNIFQPDDRKVLLRDSDSKGSLLDHPSFWPNESFSPDGKCCLFNRPASNGSLHLLETNTGKIRKLSDRSLVATSVTWRRDGSAAFCQAPLPKTDAQYQPVLIQINRDNLIDLSGKWKKSFGEWSPSLDPVWTNEGRYIVGSGLGVGGVLIRPDPWKVIHVGKLLATNHPETMRGAVCGITSLPAPGWVMTWGGGAIPGFTNYQGTRFIPYGPIKNPMAMSPDGRHMAEVDRWKKLHFRDVNLPALSAEADATAECRK